MQVTVVSFGRHPDVPRVRYSEGKLGVVLPGFARSYLITAYRYFEGLGFNGSERAQLLSYWKDRDRSTPWDQTSVKWVEAWSREAGRLDGKAAQAEQFRKDREYGKEGYVFFRAEDAYRMATFTLRDRMKRVGARSPHFQNWLAGQRTVFGEGAGWQELGEGSPKWLAQDRAYQVAAWNFYRQDVEAAVKGFREIAADVSSPWRAIAPYMVARTYTVALQTDAKWKSAAEAEVRRILKDESLSQIHTAVKSLRRRNWIQSEPETVLKEIAGTLTKPGLDLSLRQDVWDYVFLYDAIEQRKGEARLRAAGGLTEWLYCFQHPNAKTYARAADMWQATKSTAWLIAALNAALPMETGVGELLAAASRVPVDHPASTTLAYHRARLLLELKKTGEAEEILDRALSGKELGRSSRNLLLDLKARAVTDLPTFLGLLPRVPILRTELLDEGETLRYSSGRDDGEFKSEVAAAGKLRVIGYSEAKFFNEQAPLEILSKAALDPSIPGAMAVEFQRVALMRALILEQAPLYRPLSEALAKLKPGYSERLNKAIAAADDREVRQALILFTIRQPEIRPYFLTATERGVPDGKIDDYADNYWEPYIAGRDEFYLRQGSWNSCQDRSGEEEPVEFRLLKEEERRQGSDEFQRVRAAGSAAEFYGAYANGHYREDPSLLDGALRVSRYSESPKSARKEIVALWRVLMNQYPESAAARRWKDGHIYRGGWSEEDGRPRRKDVRNFFPSVACRWRPWDQ